MAAEVLKSLVHASVVVHGVSVTTPRPIKASFTVSLSNVVIYTSPECATLSCNPKWTDAFTITLSKKQFDEGILELNFLEKKSSIGLAQIPIRTLCSKHYYEKKAPETHASASIGIKTVVQPRITTIENTANEWAGFRAQLVKTDTVRGHVFLDAECTSVAVMQELLSAYKTYFIGVDNLAHLAAHNPQKLALYITSDVLNMLKVATLAHMVTDGSSTSGSSRRRNRASTRVSRVSIDANQALALLEKAFQESEPDPEDRYLLLALWRQVLSCPLALVKSKLVACGLFKIASKMLSLKEDPEIVSHFLEGLKYFFVLPDTQGLLTKKLKKGTNVLTRLIDIVAGGATNPMQGQVVMRAMDLLYYFDEPEAIQLLAESGLIEALHKLALDGSAFLALRTKSLDLFKVFPASLHKPILASGILGGFAEILASTSNRTAHHSYLGRVIGFLHFLAANDPSSIASDGIFKALIGLLVAKNSTEQNIVLAIGVLSLVITQYAPLFIDLGLPQNLIQVLLNPNTSTALRSAVLGHLALPPYTAEAELEKLINGGIMQNMFELLSSSYVEEESAMARQFLRNAKFKPEQLVSAGMISALGVMLSYETLVEIEQSKCRMSNLALLLEIATPLRKIPEFQTSAIPKALSDLLRYCPSLTPWSAEKAKLIDPDEVLFSCSKAKTELVSSSMTNTILALFDVLTDETVLQNQLHDRLFIVSVLDVITELSSTCRSHLMKIMDWTDQLEKNRLFKTIEVLLNSSLGNSTLFMSILKDFPPGYGHIDFVLKLLAESSPQKSSFFGLMELLPTMEAYLELINADAFVNTLLVSPKDLRAKEFYQLLDSETQKTPSLMAKLQTEDCLKVLLSLLSEAIFVLKTSTAPAIREGAIKARDILAKFLHKSPKMPDGGLISLIAMVSEPSSGLEVALWAFGLLKAQIDGLIPVASDLNLHGTLWNIVNRTDLTVASSPGDNETLFATEVSISAWKLLCLLPDHLTWLNALPAFSSTVTDWVFSKQPEFQEMAMNIMEPVRWSRVGCKTGAEFEAWRLNLNKGRLAYCGALKGANLDEVSKLARSFANNMVIPEDLSWVESQGDMEQTLAVYQLMEFQLRPSDQTEMAKEFQTLRTWLRFLRLCKNRKIKLRFVALLDTFHDSLFFMPDSAPESTDWHSYYRVDDEQAQQAVDKKLKKSVAALKSSTTASKALSVVGLRSSASKGVSTAKKSTNLAVLSEWKSNTAAHFQLIRFWQFTDLTTVANLNNVPMKSNALYELTYDSHRHGMNTDELAARCANLRSLMMLVRIIPHQADVVKLGSEVILGIYFPNGIITTSDSGDTDNGIKVFSWTKINTYAQQGTFKLDSGFNPGYVMNSDTMIIYSDVNNAGDIDINFAESNLTWNSTGKWGSKLYGDSASGSTESLNHIQVFRLASAPNNDRIAVITRRGFGTDAKELDFSVAAGPQRLDSVRSRTLKKVKFDVKPSSSTSSLSEESSEPESPTSVLENSESFMNRHLAKVLNDELQKHYKKVSQQQPSIGSTIPSGLVPSWIRMFRFSARALDDFSQVNLRDIVQKANAGNVPIFGIIKGRRDDMNPTEPQPIFGFYIHRGLESVGQGEFVNDPLAMLFSLRGPQRVGSVFAPVAINESEHAFRFVDETTIQFGLGTDLYLNLTYHSYSFSNPGMTYCLPESIPFMSREAQRLFTNDAPRTWQFDDVEIYFRANSKSNVLLPSPALGHLLRLLGQEDINTLQQIRWRLKYLMLSGSQEDKRQMLNEIRRSQLADLELGALEPVNNLTKRVEHPGVGKMDIRPIAVNGKEISGSDMERLLESVQNPFEGCVAPADVVPFDITFAVLSPNTASEYGAIVTKAQIEAIPLESLPYLTHAILAARRNANEPVERATRMIVFASDRILSPEELNAAFPPLQTPADDYAKIIKSNAMDHLRWYEQHAPAALDPSKQFRIGPLLIPAEEELAKRDTGMVSRAEDDFWSFLSDEADSDKLKARAIKVPDRQCFVEDYQLDQLRVSTDPVAMVQLASDQDVGTAALSAPVRSRYITVRFLPNDDNRKPLYLSALRFLGYHAENHHYLVPPKPEAMADIIPIYTANLLPDSSRFDIFYESDETAGIMHWLRETKHNGDLVKMEAEFTLLYSHHLFDQKKMTREQFFGAQRPDVYFWGGGNPTWFSYVYKNFTVCPKTFMLRHGYNKNNSFIQNFVLQGTTDMGKTWRDICSFPDHYHSYVGQAYVFTHENLDNCTTFYNGFRVLQKGHYYMGPNAAGSPFMCISEFEIFGSVVIEDQSEHTSEAVCTMVDADRSLGFSATYNRSISNVAPQ